MKALQIQVTSISSSINNLIQKHIVFFIEIKEF